jgi:2,4-dienoyl-CoA reductase (NADPH2)
VIFEPFTLRDVTFRNHVLRSSLGGRMAHYDGTVTSVWKNFEKRFAEGGVGGIVSTTLNVNRARRSPLEYPPLCDDRYVPALRRFIAEIRATGCRYVVQLGDPGYATQTSLFPEALDASSASPELDLIYGYGGTHREMSEAEIELAVADYGRAAARARDAGADGVEVTASKGYLIHQFLSPAVNRRTDGWGGTPEKRFRLLGEVTRAVRAAVGRDFLFGVRLAAADHMELPVNLRLPIALRRKGNDLPETLEQGRRLRALGVDYLHVDAGFGFPHPRVTPGDFPFEEIRIFLDSSRHLGRKASLRATLFHALPTPLAKRLFGGGWRYEEGINLGYARAFKREVGLPVIANGGFQHRSAVEKALADGDCDLVAIGRALLANPDLVRDFEAGREAPGRPCTYCNRCAGRTATSPLGCYDASRFPSVEAMEEQILAWNRPDPET